ncbi:MAG: hypothetical protein DYG98_07470 [Haliscomenobacteraceae bacterium CHB4]|nr:hypothetical protein [Haliscomenobacteraceae bacterium CHB4]
MFNLKFLVAAFLIASFSQTPCFSQTYKRDSALIKELSIQTARYKKAFLEDDVETAIALTHPEMVEKIGGVESMRQSFEKAQELKSLHKIRYSGFDFILPDSALVSEQSYQAAFPVVITTKYEDGSTLNDRNVVIAYSDIAVSKWYFLVVPHKEGEMSKLMLDFVDDNLIIPELKN